MRPRLLTFDIFGTVLDWRRGLTEALASEGVTIDADAFDRVIDAQAELESGSFRTYTEIVARSLTGVLGVTEGAAERIGREAGTWPLFPDSRDALRRLRAVAPCVATTNSDRAHGDQVQSSLGFRLDGWICAEETGRYKPDARVWHAASTRMSVPPGPWWWHVSAYGDYDLATARGLGLTCVYVARAHARPGPSDLAVANLSELAERAEAAASGPSASSE